MARAFLSGAPTLLQGWLVAQGTHRELLTSSPLYRELAHNQLLD